MSRILLAGIIDLGPIGRHGLSFISTLLKNDRNEIFIDREFIHSSSIKILQEMFPDDYKKIKFYIKNNNKKEKFDFFICFSFLLATTGAEYWFNKMYTREATIKICYPVFDGTVPPIEWIDGINKHFDLCLSPSNYVAHNLKRNGVKIDCMGLECVIFLDDFLKIKPNNKENKVYRFGCVSGHEARKNLEFLVKSFTKAFTKDEPVELFIHSVPRDNLLVNYNNLKKLVKEANVTTNIILHDEFVSQEEMMRIWSTFDAYIIPQTNTGYYTTPIEALACGLPVILSDISVHKEMLKHFENDNDLFFVPHNLCIPEYHFAFEYRHIGVSFAAKEEDYVKELRNVYSLRACLNSEDKILHRKKIAQMFSANGLFKKHNIVFNPQQIAISNNNQTIENNCLFISENLYSKYKKIYHALTTTNLYTQIIETVYPEEQSETFKAIEQCAVLSQSIEYKFRERDFKEKIKKSKYYKKIMQKASKYKTDKIPFITYLTFYLYSKISYLLTGRKRNESNDYNDND